MNKYRSRKTEIGNITFDSKAEANRYKELKLLEKAGVISRLELQPKFELQPSFKKKGKAYRAINYIADFMYCDKEKGNKMIVEDVKGFETKDFKIKRKMFEYQYDNLTLELIK